MSEYLISFRRALFLRMTVKRALKVGCVVGTILTLINQGDHILLGDWPPVWKILLTFMVLYSVSSYTSAAFISEFSRKHGVSFLERKEANG